ncbi:carbohydrate sulfotransferase 4 isoform X2 [Cuculus canorus]|uniref:carbohydrate sulfotransferase 4 isoform X2 n=1 Tax=Cuculus canorus TaxID=55661 RepID=UPI0023AA3AA3|nr:carbohydrate sulfotransferase 4 isoform X2 [Cuculus canorus]
MFRSLAKTMKPRRVPVLLTLAFLSFLFIHFQFQPCSNSALTEDKSSPVHILILSSWRSGSSFIGQIFSQHPSVFYLMEPAWHVWVRMHQNSAEVLQMAVRDLVRSAFLCDMSVFDVYMSRQKQKSDLFQWETSRALCSPPACDSFSRNDIITAHNCKTMCSKYPFSKVEEACKTYSHIVIKEVRFFDLKVLYPLLTDPSLNLKIIHLVRDPRAVFRSREKSVFELKRDSDIVVRSQWTTEETEPYDAMQVICKSHVEIYKAGTQTIPSSLRDRYLLVRYEDIVRDPLARAAQMYRFAELHFTPELQKWVHNITHGKGQGTQAFVIGSRDALRVSQAWRTTLPFEKIEKVQDVCKDAMDLLGYRLVQSEEEQKDISLDLSFAQKASE